MDWTKESKRIDHLEVEVCFLLQQSFYTGDPNNPDQLQDARYRESLDLPAFSRVVPTMARTSEAANHCEQLANYYRDIVERASAAGVDFNSIRQHFWLRLWFWNTSEDVSVSFPWYDSLSEMQQFFGWVQGDRDTDSFTDIDQGWQLDAVRIGGFLHIRQSDPDYAEEHANLEVAFQPFAATVAEVEARAISIISTLSRSLGSDVWTEHVADATFGTAEWQPKKATGGRGEASGFFRRLFRS